LTMKTFAPPPSQRRFDAGYECELPPAVRAELIGPRRPAILPTEDPSVRCRIPKPESKDAFYFVLAICLITLAGPLYTSWRQGDTREHAKTNKAISQPLAPQPTPQPTPTPGSTVSLGRQPRGPEQLFRTETAEPRAVLVKLPPPRAQLVRVPEAVVALERQPAGRHVGCRRYALGLDLGSWRGQGRLDRSVRGLV